MSTVKIGCCGFPVGRKNYYRHFPCVEVQQTFYHPPRLAVLARWRREAPEDFEFTIKAWQLITHTPQSPTYRRLRMEVPEERSDRYGNFRPTEDVFEAWETTRGAAETLGARIIIFQTPQSFRPTPENKTNMRGFFQEIKKDGFILGWEPRGWDAAEGEGLCSEWGLFRISDPFQDRGRGGDITYWRLHGIGGYRYRYSDDDLSLLRQWVSQEGTAYAMFNNLSMFQDGLRFQQLWRREGGEGP